MFIVVNVLQGCYLLFSNIVPEFKTKKHYMTNKEMMPRRFNIVSTLMKH